MNHLYNLNAMNDNEPVAPYKFNWWECFVTVGCATLLAFIVITGFFSIFKMWIGI